MYYILPHYSNCHEWHQVKIKTNPDDRPALALSKASKWCAGHRSSEFGWTILNDVESTDVIVYFEDERDALLFQLCWT